MADNFDIISVPLPESNPYIPVATERAVKVKIWERSGLGAKVINSVQSLISKHTVYN